MTTDFVEVSMVCGTSFHMTNGAARARLDLEELKQDYKDPKNH